jgi:hypothetical protein
MEYKKVSITICDDCLNYDLLEESKTINQRHFAYFCSALMSSVFLVGMFYWTYSVILHLPESEYVGFNTSK